jgi:phosphate transport system substrate-binding protein
MNRFIKRIAVAMLALGSSAALAETRLQGAGATFPNPIYQRWTTQYQKVNPDVKIDYQSIGSGGGIKGITEKTVDFAGSDAPMSKKEIAAAGGEIVHIPTVAGAVVLAYNAPGFEGDLKLDGDVVAQIFMGKITKWSDPKIAALNEGAKLPDAGITPAYRTDGSGTNFVFTNYLCTQNEDFKSSIGPGKQVKWPVGQGGKGNEGVTAVVQQTPGAIGYIELNYAIANKIPFAMMKNKDGNFVKASPETVSAAGAGALASMKDSLAVDIWNQPGPNSYPISSQTYIIVYKDLGYVKDPAKARALVGFLKWALTDGQKMAPEMTYAPLAEPVQKKALDTVNGLMWDGKAMAASQ